MSDLKRTWNDVASRWDDWAPPLRPCPEDLRIMVEMVAHWHRTVRHQADQRRIDPSAPVRVFLCGVTPEIAAMEWPFPVELTGMDQAESMVRLVWPGDLPGVRRGLVGSWLASGLAPGSQDIVIGDGGIVFFAYPDAERALLTELRRTLAPSGLFLYRHYAQAPVRERVEEVLSAARVGGIGNFHVFKWRLAMALQEDSSIGVRQHDIWSTWTRAGIEAGGLPQPGWSARAVSTIHFYRDKQARLYFPTRREFEALVGEQYADIEVRIPGYELGERCPIFAARPRV